MGAPEAPTTAGAPGAPATEPPEGTVNVPPPQGAGLRVNFFNHLNDGIAKILGVPADVAASLLAPTYWKSLSDEQRDELRKENPRQAAIMDFLQKVTDNPSLGHEWWKNVMGDVGSIRQGVEPQTTGERMAAAAGETTSALVVPGLSAEAILAKEWNAGTELLSGVLKSAEIDSGTIAHILKGGGFFSNLFMGTTSGAAGEYAKEQAPDSLKPTAEVLGQIAGGLPAAATDSFLTKMYRGVADTMHRLFNPTETANLKAAGEIADAASRSPGGRTQFENDLRNSEDVVPGSQQTVYQSTGNKEVGQLEKEVSSTSYGAPKFQQRKEDQQVAQLKQLESIADPQARSEAVRDYIKQRLQDVENEHAEKVKTAAYGLADRLAEAGGTRYSTEADYGEGMRGPMQEAADASAARVRALEDAIDPTGQVPVDTAGLKSSFADIEASIPKAAKGPAGDERAILRVVSDGFEDQEPFGEMVTLRQRIEDEMRKVRNSNPDSYERLDKMLAAVDDTIAQKGGELASGENGGQVMAGLRQEAGETPVPRTLTADEARQAPTVYGVVGDDLSKGIFVTPDRQAAEDMVASKAQPSIASRQMENDYDVIPFKLKPGAQISPDEIGRGKIMQPGDLESVTAAGERGRREQAVNTFNETSARASEAQAAREAHEAQYERGPVGAALATTGTGDYKTVARNVASRIFDDPEKFDAFLTASPHMEQEIADYAAFSMRRFAAKDGVISPSRLNQWMSDHAFVMQRFPELMAKFRNVEGAQAMLDQALANQKAALEQFQQGAVEKVLGAGKVSDAVGSTIGNPDEFGALVDKVRADPDARAGLKRAVIEHMLSVGRGLTTKEAGTSGLGRINGDYIIKFLANNSESLSKLFSPAEMDNIRGVARDIAMTNRSVEAARGGNRAERTATGLSFYIIRHGFAALGAAAGHALGIGGVIGGHNVGLMTGAGADIYLARRMAKVDAAIADMMLDKNLASAWLAKYSVREASRQHFSDMMARRVRTATWGSLMRDMEGDRE